MNERILAIDDNPVNLKLASDLLELDGYAVMKAVDAEQAREMLENLTP